MKSDGKVSPERAKVWREKSPNYYYNYQKYNQQKLQRFGNGKVSVVYYLSRNGKLDHPHFTEVALSSSNDGLYLRDVIERLNALRGRGMASMYSWSCKRSHKGGYVWHDLCEDDILIPAHGNEYVLKGIELFEDPSPGCYSPAAAPLLLLQNQKALIAEAPSSSRSQEYSSSSSSLTSSNGSLSLTEYKVYKSDGLSDASTQTEEKTCKDINENLEICARDLPTEDHSLQPENDTPNANRMSRIKDTHDNNSSTCSSDAVESRTDARELNSFRILEEDEFRLRPSSRFKASNMLLQLISCGSISVKDHRSFGLIPTYKPKFLHSEIESPFFPSSLTVGEVDFSKDSLRLNGVRLLEDKEGLATSSSCNSRTDRNVDSVKGKEDEEKFPTSKFIPRSQALVTKNQPRSESMRLSDTIRKDVENVFKIEERLASGARVIIQSNMSSVENGAVS